MIPGYATVMAASANDRRDLFVGAGNRLGTVQQNTEKDFWVCWTLDALFNGLQAGGPRLLFKGGTSLSKAYGLISRFSEDIDITVFRDDIGQAATVEELEALSGKKRAERLDAIRDACQHYISGPLLEQLSGLLRGLLETSNQAAELGRVEADPDDPDHQTLLLWYPTVTADGALAQIWRCQTSPQLIHAALSGTKARFSMACGDGGTDAASCEAVDSGFHVTTMTSIAFSPPMRGKTSQEMLLWLPIAFVTHACSSTGRTSTSQRPLRAATP